MSTLRRMPDFKLERYFAQWEFTAPYLLCSSDIEGWRMSELLALADRDSKRLWSELRLGYTEYTGHPALRHEVSRLCETVHSEEILMFSGAEEAIGLCLPQLVGPGDHAIVTWPGYQSLHEVPRAAGADISLWELREDEGWIPNVDRLRQLLRPQTRLLVVNFPHNPTGALPAKDVWRDIVGVAREANLWLFSDEVYRESEYDPSSRLSAAVDAYERGISLGVMSKTYALAGLRIGWIAAKDRPLLQRVAAQKDYTTIDNSAPSEVLALIALRARSQVLQRSLAIINTNLPLLDRFFKKWAGRVSWIRPKAGAIGFPRLLGAQSVEDVAAQLVKSQGVLLLPASVYDHPGNHFRVGFGRHNFSEALARFDDFLATHPPA